VVERSTNPQRLFLYHSGPLFVTPEYRVNLLSISNRFKRKKKRCGGPGQLLSHHTRAPHPSKSMPMTASLPTMWQTQGNQGHQAARSHSSSIGSTQPRRTTVLPLQMILTMASLPPLHLLQFHHKLLATRLDRCLMPSIHTKQTLG
jgi:hypothetical protein